MGFQILVLTYFLVALAVIQHVGANIDAGFVQRKGTHFILNGKTHYVNGFNSYWLTTMASDPSTSSKVTSTFQQASQHGLNVGRTWAFNDGGYKALQISPGSYDENVFKALDFVISEASKYGVKLILSLVNNWNDFGGKNKYVQWAKERGQNIKNDDDFFTHPVVKQYYKNHVKAVLTRKNTISGVLYKDDPTIFAWELMNEPRYVNDSGKSIQNWVSEMAPYVKSIDSNHMLEIGLEGFYSETMLQKKQFNPNTAQVGTDFISNNQIPQIDFATIHIYPDQWIQGSEETTQNVFVDKWIGAHIQDSNTVLGKPIIIAEFGKSSKSAGYSIDKRDSYFKKVYNAISTSAISGGSCAGGIFWQLLSQGMDNMGDGYEVIFENSLSTSQVIKQQSLKMSSIRKQN
ncbi:putative mannan endo-1,4-beta-mannosidase [Medicago truncatula]|uniref:mannan endo-1,4-beta-mannosidase n=1 Tax=Medicago truncatula TaxID=3880 RepID=G7IBN8_MEDTR|nr:mannan endo-1,4-beta-mannosidase 4 [Medicago truncatula]AES61539.1 mannan endo-1,4-beta-mannosidase-like protein [Medicago truncatula]RHN80927.1 putative mannan endo-1,4-beta-mannosidase [Medicago truncatula]